MTEWPTITEPVKHPLEALAEWRRGCSCGDVGKPWECTECTMALLAAIEQWHRPKRAACDSCGGLVGARFFRTTIDCLLRCGDPPTVAQTATVTLCEPCFCNEERQREAWEELGLDLPPLDDTDQAKVNPCGD